jgi:hypothetical protein
MHLSAAAVARIKSPRTGQVDPGLALRVSYGGARTWVWFYRQDGKLRRLTLGSSPKLGLAGARETRRQAREQLSKGLEPVSVAPIASPADEARTVRNVVEDWLKRDQSTNRKFGTPARAYTEVERIMNREVLPTWGNRRITDIIPDVNKLIDDVRRPRRRHHGLPGSFAPASAVPLGGTEGLKTFQPQSFCLPHQRSNVLTSNVVRTI